MSTASCTSPSASSFGLPISCVTSRAIFSFRSSRRRATRWRTSPRRGGGVEAQLGNAAVAAFTARSTSFAVLFGAFPIAFPVAGSTVSIWIVFLPGSSHEPSIQLRAYAIGVSGVPAREIRRGGYIQPAGPANRASERREDPALGRERREAVGLRERRALDEGRRVEAALAPRRGRHPDLAAVPRERREHRLHVGPAVDARQRLRHALRREPHPLRVEPHPPAASRPRRRAHPRDRALGVVGRVQHEYAERAHRGQQPRSSAPEKRPGRPAGKPPKRRSGGARGAVGVVLVTPRSRPRTARRLTIPSIAPRNSTAEMTHSTENEHGRCIAPPV